jgi:hypothetical protein
MQGIRKVTHHILRDIKSGGYIEDTSRMTDEQRRNLVAFTCLLYHPHDGGIYCGITAFDGEIFWRYDPAAKSFISLHYGQVAEEFEVKIHRSLCLAPDGTIYGATACLYTVNERLRAPGGAIFRHAPGSAVPEKLAIPVQYDYIQTIALDEQRRLIYGLTYPVFNFFVYHLDTGEVEDYDYIGSITHISAIDDVGCFWGTWDVAHHHLFKYDPATREITWFHHGTPDAAREANIMYPGAGPVDVMINGGDGYLYIGTTGGSLCRLDPTTAEVECLGHPGPSRRLPGLLVWDDDLLLGAGGDEEGGFVFTYSRKTGAINRLGPIIDTQSGLPLYRVHDVCRLGDTNTIFVAETDVPNRSGYLWECELDV